VITNVHAARECNSANIATLNEKGLTTKRLYIAGKSCHHESITVEKAFYTQASLKVCHHLTQHEQHAGKSNFLCKHCDSVPTCQKIQLAVLACDSVRWRRCSLDEAVCLFQVDLCDIAVSFLAQNLQLRSGSHEAFLLAAEERH